jgi:hypothetical protein
MRFGITILCWAVKPVFAIAMARYFDLPAVECFLTKNTKAAVVERIPVPELILGAQDRQLILCMDMNFHRGVNCTLLDRLASHNRDDA